MFTTRKLRENSVAGMDRSPPDAPAWFSCGGWFAAVEPHKHAETCITVRHVKHPGKSGSMQVNPLDFRCDVRTEEDGHRCLEIMLLVFKEWMGNRPWEIRGEVRDLGSGKLLAYYEDLGFDVTTPDTDSEESGGESDGDEWPRSESDEDRLKRYARHATAAAGGFEVFPEIHMLEDGLEVVPAHPVVKHRSLDDARSAAEAHDGARAADESPGALGPPQDAPDDSRKRPRLAQAIIVKL